MERFLCILFLALCPIACRTNKTGNSAANDQKEKQVVLADQMEESLFKYILDPWYPLVIDTVNGGYHSDFTHDWSFAEGSQERALVQQARHLWSTSLVYERYPHKEMYLDYAANGFRFLKN